MILKAVKIIVSGKVQGVYYRQSTKVKAMELHIKGTVRNLENGNVEIFAEGDEANIQQLILWCHQGPEAANVSKVEVKDAGQNGFTSFQIIR